MVGTHLTSFNTNTKIIIQLYTYSIIESVCGDVTCNMFALFVVLLFVLDRISFYMNFTINTWATKNNTSLPFFFSLSHVVYFLDEAVDDDSSDDDAESLEELEACRYDKSKAKPHSLPLSLCFSSFSFLCFFTPTQSHTPFQQRIYLFLLLLICVFLFL